MGYMVYNVLQKARDITKDKIQCGYKSSTPFEIDQFSNL